MENNIEIIKAEFFDKDAIMIPNYYLYRINNNNRFYAKIEMLEEKEDLKISIAAGHTTIIQKSSPTPYYLIDWQIKQGDKAELLSQGAADFGSFGHFMISELVKGKKLIFSEDWINSIMQDYMSDSGKDFERCLEYTKLEKRNMLKDLYCFIKWFQDYKVKVIACEYPIFVDLAKPYEVDNFKVGSYSAILDFVCELTLPEIKSGKNKRPAETIKAIVDWKFRHKHDFYESEKVQLYAQLQAWNYENPDIKIDKVFNWSPNNFRMGSENPSYYDFKDQTISEGDNTPLLWESYLMQFHARKDYFKGMNKKHDFRFVEIGIDDDLDIIQEIDLFEELSQTGEF